MTEDMRAIFQRQHAASRTGTAPTAAERRASLAKLATLVRDNDEAIIAAISADFGNRSADETRLLEIVPTLNAIRHARKSVARWMKPEKRHVSLTFQPARAWVRHEPLGVIGIISPWNYPLLLALAPLVDALAAGNRAMIKPSELTPGLSDLLAKLIAQAFDADQVAVVPGDVGVARAFSSLPFDHLIFTGSTEVGRHVMRAAAENLTPVTLELGGKSPAIVCPDYGLAKAAKSVAFGKFLNGGQTCIAPDYALVPANDVARFGEMVIGEARRAYPAIDGNPGYTGIISTRHRDRLLGGIAEAEAAGATLLRHGGSDDDGRIAPTIVIDPPADGLLMREEIFGPVLPVLPYRSLDEALAIVNAHGRPLALYCFSDDKRSRDRVLDGAISGGVTINGTLLHIAQDALPFGGIGPSGIGAYHGHDGFRRLSHARAVHQIGRINAFEKLGPPWGKLAATAYRMLAR